VDWLTSWWNSYEATNLSRILLASFLSGLIGIEREVHGRAAGFRTHLLVGVAACLMMVVSEYFFEKYGGLRDTVAVRMDPARVAAQIVVGIGFLGAGVIIKSGTMVRGLTTAACLWMVAGIGMAVGTGLYSPAVMVTMIALFNLVFLKQIERLIKKDHFYTLIIYSSSSGKKQKKIADIIQKTKMRVVKERLEIDTAAGRSRYEYSISTNKTFDQETLTEVLLALPDIQKVTIH
jgi:putative Mg2+ transporter-C (MgtC) family protein